MSLKDNRASQAERQDFVDESFMLTKERKRKKKVTYNSTLKQPEFINIF